jgi:hypothetical protein
VCSSCLIDCAFLAIVKGALSERPGPNLKDKNVRLQIRTGCNIKKSH